jgi:hypothetical protein
MKRSFWTTAATSFVSSSSNAAAAFSTTATRNNNKIFTIEWSPRIGQIQSQLILPNDNNNVPTTYFVLPDLPHIYTDNDRATFLGTVEPSQRIHTIATCRHETSESLLSYVKSTIEPESIILLVGGNDTKKKKNNNKKNNKDRPSFLSTIEAARILRNRNVQCDNVLWGVTNPNDPQSIGSVQKKVDSGIDGFLTQPLLRSYAYDTLQQYKDNNSNHRLDDDDNDDDDDDVDSDDKYSDPLSHQEHASKKLEKKNITLLPGLALPTSVQSLQFWAKLIVEEDDNNNSNNNATRVMSDPLFRSHIAYFSQPYVTPLAWIGRELESHLSPSLNNIVDGIHFMPLKNTDDLCTIFKALSRRL